MVYRTRGRDAGALGYYMAKESIRVYSKLHEGGTGYRLIKTRALVREYEQWERLGTTQRALQTWYRMHIPYNTGWLGRRRSEIAVSFFDGSGDFLSGGAHTEADRQLWNDAFIKASVMIFCVPMWAVLPDRRKLTEDSHWEAREEFLQSFNNVRQEYADLRRKAEASHPVQVIIALTQADSPLCEAEPQSTWITPYLTNPERYLRMLRTSRGVARYLASARAVSSYLYERCESGRDQDASDVVNAEFGGGPPWLVPVTAIDGEELDRVERRGLSLSQRHRLGKPVPAHVELPLLIALVEQCNALA
jgi:hypothetical protein